MDDLLFTLYCAPPFNCPIQAVGCCSINELERNLIPLFITKRQTPRRWLFTYFIRRLIVDFCNKSQRKIS